MKYGVVFQTSTPPRPSFLPWLLCLLSFSPVPQSTVKLIWHFICPEESPVRGSRQGLVECVEGRRGAKGSKVKSSKIMRLFRPAPTEAKEQSTLSNWVSQHRSWNNRASRAASKLPWQACYCCRSSRVWDTRSAAANQADRKSRSRSLWFLPRPQLSPTIPVPQQRLWLNLPPFYISFRVRFTH